MEYLAFGYFDKQYCGLFVRYNEYGEVTTKGQYHCKNEKKYKDCNIKDGNWEYYDGDGKLTKVEQYDNGKLLETVLH